MGIPKCKCLLFVIVFLMSAFAVNAVAQTQSKLAAGMDHTAIINSDGTLWAWGANFNGSVGDGTNAHRNTPVQVGSDNDWASITACNRHTFALKSDGTLWAWGGNHWGQLGDGTTTSRNTPVQIGSGDDWASVTASSNHTLALKSDGTLWAWGNNSIGQLGNGGTAARNTPVQIGSDNDWASVTAGGEVYTLALKSDGTLWAWGGNSDGFGDGVTTNSRTPIQIGSDNDWTSIKAIHYRAFALKSDGTLWAWSRELEDGTWGDHNMFVQIGSDNDWISLTAGGLSGFETQAFALKSNGTLWAWGYNANGQLGDGTNHARSEPVQVGSDNDWVSVTAGERHTIALKSDGTFWTWGGGWFGQLGNGVDGDGVNEWKPVNIYIPTTTVPITSASITITAPVTDASAVTIASGTGNFTTGTVTWSPADEIFKGNTIYTSTVMLTAAANYTFTGLTESAVTVNGNPAVISNNTGSAITLSYTFESTGSSTAIAESNRKIPGTPDKGEGDGIWANNYLLLPGEFTAGPNPAVKFNGKANFFWQGREIERTQLRVYDASGNLVKRISISDKSANNSKRRNVGTWNLKDPKGRSVSAGTYLVKGVISTKDGEKEKVSLMLNVR